MDLIPALLTKRNRKRGRDIVNWVVRRERLGLGRILVSDSPVPLLIFLFPLHLCQHIILILVQEALLPVELIVFVVALFNLVLVALVVLLCIETHPVGNSEFRV